MAAGLEKVLQEHRRSERVHLGLSPPDRAILFPDRGARACRRHPFVDQLHGQARPPGDELGGFLYLGSTSEPFVGRLPAP